MSYFKCNLCRNFWRIAEAPVEKNNWFCPWCGHGQDEEKSADVPQNDGPVQEIKKNLEVAGKELERLLAELNELGDMFKKK